MTIREIAAKTNMSVSYTHLDFIAVELVAHACSAP